MTYPKNSVQYFFLFLLCFSSQLLYAASQKINSTASKPSENKLKPHILIVYGPPGSSRTKIALKLSNQLNIPKISFAELLAESLHDESLIGDHTREYMKHGGDIPAELFCMIIDKRMKSKDCHIGCIWEGIPCSVEQTKTVQEKFSRSFHFSVFSIHTTSSWLIHKVQNRFFCSSCGRVYNEPYSKPKIQGRCDICDHPLKRRHEDSPEFIQSRHQMYEKKISPVLEYWKRQRLLTLIPGDAHIETIYSDVEKQVQTSLYEQIHSLT